MFGHGFAFDKVWYLALLVVLPVLWWIGLRTLSSLGKWRRIFVVLLRSAVIALIVFALADMQYQRRSDRVTVLYLLDQSISIPEPQRLAMIEYYNASVEQHRDDRREDRAGVIVFGRNAEVELPPVDFDAKLRPTIESLIDTEYTDLAGAIQRAQAMFPHDAARRVVVVTDGNENMGDALQQARAATAAGVSIDVVPIIVGARGDVSVERVVIPGDVRKGQPFDARVVLENATEPDQPGGEVSGKLIFVRKAGEREEVLAEQQITVPPGKRVFRVREEVGQPDFYTYVARFVPDQPAADAMVQNNVATGFTHVMGKGQVLLIEDWENKGDFDFLVSRLRNEDIQVTVRASDQLFTSLPELQRYDSVILANVPRSSGTDGANVSNFTNEQIAMLVRNTRELGCGLIMIGGRNSFGAGGWTNTELEKAMPVDFQIKSAKIAPVGALVLMMHGGEIPRANFWQKKVAIQSIQALGNRDYCGLVEWSGGRDRWLWGQSRGGLLRIEGNRPRMLSLIDRLTIGDMPQFGPAMKMAAQAFTRVKDAAVKHMIIISDGDPSPPANSIINDLIKQKVTVSTVDVAQPLHAPFGAALLQRIAQKTGGKYYAIRSANALPKIYQREVRRIARPLIYEPRPAVSPVITADHEIIRGVGQDIPPLSGFVLTTVKESPLVEVVLTSPLPADRRNASVLACWTYGLGKAVALTTDAGTRWTNQWTGWAGYDKLFSQIVRWSMRPTGNVGNYTVTTDVRDGSTRVVITALDEDDEYLNFATIKGSVFRPDMTSQTLDIQQVAPGRYVAEFESETSGNYLLNIIPGVGQGTLRTGVNVGYSDEYRVQETNLPLLESMASLPAKGGEPGRVSRLQRDDSVESLLDVNPFRRDLPPAVANQDIWPTLVLLASCLFFADVFVRRVHVHFEWLPVFWAWVNTRVLKRSQPVAAEATMQRLRSRKAEVGQQLESRHAAARFAPQPDQTPDLADLPEMTSSSTKRSPPRPATPDKSTPDDDQDEGSYTSRLLKAKRDVWKDRDQDSN